MDDCDKSLMLNIDPRTFKLLTTENIELTADEFHYIYINLSKLDPNDYIAVKFVFRRLHEIFISGRFQLKFSFIRIFKKTLTKFIKHTIISHEKQFFDGYIEVQKILESKKHIFCQDYIHFWNEYFLKCKKTPIDSQKILKVQSRLKFFLYSRKCTCAPCFLMDCGILYSALSFLKEILAVTFLYELSEIDFINDIFIHLFRIVRDQFKNGCGGVKKLYASISMAFDLFDFHDNLTTAELYHHFFKHAKFYLKSHITNFADTFSTTLKAECSRHVLVRIGETIGYYFTEKNKKQEIISKEDTYQMGYYLTELFCLNTPGYCNTILYNEIINLQLIISTHRLYNINYPILRSIISMYISFYKTLNDNYYFFWFGRMYILDILKFDKITLRGKTRIEETLEDIIEGFSNLSEKNEVQQTLSGNLEAALSYHCVFSACLLYLIDYHHFDFFHHIELIDRLVRIIVHILFWHHENTLLYYPLINLLYIIFLFSARSSFKMTLEQYETTSTFTTLYATHCDNDKSHYLNDFSDLYYFLGPTNTNVWGIFLDKKVDDLMYQFFKYMFQKFFSNFSHGDQCFYYNELIQSISYRNVFIFCKEIFLYRNIFSFFL